MNTVPIVRLRPVVRFREFPLGTIHDPSLRPFMADTPWPDQENVLDYLRSGFIYGLAMGGAGRDQIDRSGFANPMIEGRGVSGASELTDGEWYWPAALIYYVEKHNVRLPDEFMAHAARHGWRVNRQAIPLAQFECPYFDQ